MHTAKAAPTKIEKVVVIDIAPIDTTLIYKNINAFWTHVITRMVEMNLKGKNQD